MCERLIGGEWVTIHYNGHASTNDRLREDGGLWLCENSEFIAIEDIL